MIDISDGTTIQTYETEALWQQYVDGRLYAVGESKVTAGDLDGSIEWSADINTQSFVRDILDRQGYVFVTYHSGGYSVIRADTGDTAAQHDQWARQFALRNDMLAATNLLGAVELELTHQTLNIGWETQFEQPYDTCGPPVFASDRLYVPGTRNPVTDGPQGAVLILTPSGERHQQLPFQHTPIQLAATSDSLFVGTSVITHSDFGTAGNLHAFDSDGTKRWTYNADRGIKPLVAAEQTVYAIPHEPAGPRRPLLAIDAQTGEIRWTLSTAGHVSAGAVGETLLIAGKNRVRALR